MHCLRLAGVDATLFLVVSGVFVAVPSSSCLSCVVRMTAPEG